MTEGSSDERRWEERFAVPVLVAALASVPAVFLTLLDDPAETIGNIVNWATGAVLVAETVVLFAVSESKRSWLSKHLGLVLLTVGVVVAVALAVGPVQLLRLLRVFGALRIIRAGRIVKAARILRARAGLTGPWTKVASVAAGVLVAAFVAVVLADPTSRSRQLLEQWTGELDGGVLAALALVAGLLLAAATYVVMRQRQAERRDG